jgi:hypothetical protein
MLGRVDSGKDLHFPLEPRGTFRVDREGLRQNLQGDVASELGVAGPMDLVHTSHAERRQDFIGPRREPVRTPTNQVS